MFFAQFYHLIFANCVTKIIMRILTRIYLSRKFHINLFKNLTNHLLWLLYDVTKPLLYETRENWTTRILDFAIKASLIKLIFLLSENYQIYCTRATSINKTIIIGTIQLSLSHINCLMSQNDIFDKFFNRPYRTMTRGF